MLIKRFINVYNKVVLLRDWAVFLLRGDGSQNCQRAF